MDWYVLRRFDLLDLAPRCTDVRPILVTRQSDTDDMSTGDLDFLPGVIRIDGLPTYGSGNGNRLLLRVHDLSKSLHCTTSPHDRREPKSGVP